MYTDAEDRDDQFFSRTFKLLVVLFLGMAGNFAFLVHILFADDHSAIARAIDHILPLLWFIFHLLILIAVFVIWTKIKELIKEP